MVPMITSPEDVRRLKRLVSQVKRELGESGVEFAEHVPLGIMIETPAAALLSCELAREVDFFSIGTNDLTQYTLAWDRQNPALPGLGEEALEAVLRLVELTVKNAHEAGIEVGICGQLATEAALTESFLTLGVDQLSMPPGEILGMKARIRAL